jgi:uncharacterized protein YqgC (DUF456 family)
LGAFLAIVAILSILAGIIGCVVPLLPGLPISFMAVLLYGWYDGFEHIGPNYLVVIGSLTIFSIVTDYIMIALGSKVFGSSRQSTAGAVLGSLLGLFIFPPLGILIFCFLGAFAVEYYLSHDMSRALKAAVGAVLGFFAGVWFKVALGLIILLSFIIKIA